MSWACFREDIDIVGRVKEIYVRLKRRRERPKKR